jgi:hypothetical protein
MTTVVQQNYSPQIRPFVVGQIVDETGYEVGTRNCETVAGIAFGLAVSQGAADKGCIIGGSKFIGISVRDVTLGLAPVDPLSASYLTLDAYGQHENVAVCSRGHIVVMAYDDVVANDPLYYNTTTGTFGNSASGEAADGNIVFTTQPVDATSVTLNGGAPIVFKNVVTDATTQCQIGPTLGDTLVNLAAFITANPGSDANIGYFDAVAYPTSPGGAGEGSGANTLLLAAKAPGTAPNSYTIATTTAGATRSAATILGGTASATAVAGASWKTSAIDGQLAVVSLGIQQ